jgi:hypothetical protein
MVPTVRRLLEQTRDKLMSIAYPEYTRGVILTLKPISKKGKDRISTYGDQWVVHAVAGQVVFDSAPGPYYLLQSITPIKERKYLFWMRARNDAHVEVVASDPR